MSSRPEMNRKLLALLAVLTLVASAGCLAYVTDGGEVSNETLDTEPPAEYVFDSESDARIDLQGSTFTAVYAVPDDGEMRIYQETGYGVEEPRNPRAFRYQYPNGTVITGSEFRASGGEIERTADEVWVRFDDDMTEGKVAFAGDGSPRRFVLPTFVEGTYEIVLPPGFTTDFALFGEISPSGYEVDRGGDRERITWSEDVTTDTVLVQAYSERDFWIFLGLVGIALVVGAAGLYRFRRQLEALRERRLEMGIGSEGDDGPPRGPR